MMELVAKIHEQLLQMTPKILSGLFTLLVFWLAGVICELVLRTLGVKYSAHNDILTLVGRVCRLGLLILGIISAMGTMGLNITALMTSLGLTGFALGFA